MVKIGVRSIQKRQNRAGFFMLCLLAFLYSLHDFKAGQKAGGSPVEASIKKAPHGFLMRG
jgi:hypothetical protein